MRAAVRAPRCSSDDGIAADEPAECLNPKAAVMRAEALLRKEGHRPGAIAFSRTGDLATGHFSDAKVIRKFGEVGRRRDSMQLQLLAWNRQWHGCRAILQLAPDQRARGNTGAVRMKRTAAAHQEPKPLKMDTSG